MTKINAASVPTPSDLDESAAMSVSEDHPGEQLCDLPEDKKFPLARFRTLL